MDLKIIAMYLPQFHRVKENDEWWGEGFTDWVSAKNAVPLFEGHYQPRVPQNKNYYDLMDKRIVEWQTSLMHQYGVDGMCFYHYWFKDGRRILERPAENLLQWKDIDMPFCFCWANETWAHSWSNIKKKNVWINKGETNTGDGDGVLLRQEYGNEEDWIKHLKYLVRFFKDPRYIKVDNKPLFLLYQTSDIKCIKEMLEVWNREIKNDFDGVYLIGSFCDARSGECIDGELCLPPAGGLKSLYEEYTRSGVYRVQYDKVWEEILSEGCFANKTYFGGLVGFDDTPRRGIHGIVIENSTPKKFEKYLTKLMAKNVANGSEIVFINAWNEWGEGMYLEPDEVNGIAYLEAILRAKEKFSSLIGDFQNVRKNRYVTYLREKQEKNGHYLSLLDKWMSLKERGESVADRLSGKGIMSILIYGYGILGKHLLTELKQSDIKIKGIIDKRKNRIVVNYPVYLPSDDLPECDAVVVTADYYIYDIKNSMQGKGHVLLTMNELLET